MPLANSCLELTILAFSEFINMAGILDQFVKELAVLSNYWFVKKKKVKIRAKTILKMCCVCWVR